MATAALKSVSVDGNRHPTIILDFDAIYRKYRQRVYSLYLSLTRDAALAEDLTQEAFLVLLSKCHTFRGESALHTWFYRIAFNLFLMRLRKKKVTETSLDGLLEISPAKVLRANSWARDDALLRNVPERILLDRAISVMAAGPKTVLVLHVIEGLTHEEIARRLGLTISGSKSRLHRAKKELRGILGRMQARGGVRGEPVLHLNEHAPSYQGCLAS